MNATWSRFCIVGFGGHARTKLIPAIVANGQEVIGVVSHKPEARDYASSAFASVAEAVASLPPDTAFVIASPPVAHFCQALPILEAGRDVIVEKPPFVTEREARLAVQASTRSGALLIDGFMNRHTRTHGHFVDTCNVEMPAEIACSFTIPEAPAGTFRSDPAVGSSNLYDIGSYLLAALLDIGLSLDGLGIDRVDHAGTADRERLSLSGSLDGVRVTALVGVDRVYANRLSLRWSNGREIAYQPFFYGREARREIVYSSKAESRTEILEDVNAFQAMFAVPREEWRAAAPVREARLVALTAKLERLGRRLVEARGG